MWQELAMAIPVFLSSALKFILGPIFGEALGLHPVTTWIATVSGMMLSVVAITFFGGWLRRRVLKKRPGEPQQATSNRKFSGIINKYGLGGVAFLTPLFLTPIGGTIIAVSMGKPRERILLFMFISAAGWALIFTVGIYAFGKAITNWMPELLK
jgi:membrane protein DedA with SNARE-associated domain